MSHMQALRMALAVAMTSKRTRFDRRRKPKPPIMAATFFEPAAKTVPDSQPRRMPKLRSAHLLYRLGVAKRDAAIAAEAEAAAQARDEAEAYASFWAHMDLLIEQAANDYHPIDPDDF